ncbi:MAG: alpha-E domain-containing protein [Pseudomonadota bacterium]
MLGKTAGGLFWMSRSLERSENTARLVEAGFRIALTRSQDAEQEWKSVITTAGVRAGYEQRFDDYTAPNVLEYLLRDKTNPSSVMSVLENSRQNARLVRTALTTEVWEAVNESWIVLKEVLKKPVRETELPEVLRAIRSQSALVRGAVHGTMLRTDIYAFLRLGTFLERADNTARIIDVKYYTLLPTAAGVGSRLDNVQWEILLRSVSAHRAFSWLNESEMTPAAVAEFLILDKRLPRSLLFCVGQVAANLRKLAEDYGQEVESRAHAEAIHKRLQGRTIQSIFEDGLHDFTLDFIASNNRLGHAIESDYRFTA